MEWQEVFGELRDYITNYIVTGHPIFSDDFKGQQPAEPTEKASENTLPKSAILPANEMEERIVNLLEEYVRANIFTHMNEHGIVALGYLLKSDMDMLT